jgi:predicted N-acetyltransferase YhbS
MEHILRREAGQILKIRQERISDYPEVYELVKISFATSSDSDGTESDYLDGVRKKDVFVPELSLVAELENGKLVGQVVLYKTDIVASGGTITELVLSPICVHPDYFRQGIARLMMEYAFHIARKMGYTAVFLCGEPQFYRKIGFAPTYEHEIYHITDTERNAEWCMVLELVDGALKNINGIIDIK